MLSEIGSARGLLTPSRFASRSNASRADEVEESFNRTLVADLVLQRDSDMGLDLFRSLAVDSSMDAEFRIYCIRILVDLDRESAVTALAKMITDTAMGWIRYWAHIDICVNWTNLPQSWH